MIWTITLRSGNALVVSVAVLLAGGSPAGESRPLDPRPALAVRVEVSSRDYGKYMRADTARLRSALGDSVPRLLNSYFGFVNWGGDGASDTLVVRWEQDSSSYVGALNVTMYLRAQRDRVFREKAEPWAALDRSLGRPGGAAATVVFGRWMARLDTILSARSPEVITRVLTRVPLRARAVVAPSRLSAEVHLRAAEINAEEERGPSFRVRAKMTDSLSRSGRADLSLEHCGPRKTGGTYVCLVDSLSFLGETLLVANASPGAALLRSSQLHPDSLFVRAYTPARRRGP